MELFTVIHAALSSLPSNIWIRNSSGLSGNQARIFVFHLILMKRQVSSLFLFDICDSTDL